MRIANPSLTYPPYRCSMYANPSQIAGAAPGSVSTVSGRGIAAMIGISLMMLPLYAVAIWSLVWLWGGYWPGALVIYLGVASMAAGLGVMFALDRGAVERPDRDA